jgi:hypothetical protein
MSGDVQQAIATPGDVDLQVRYTSSSAVQSNPPPVSLEVCGRKRTHHGMSPASVMNVTKTPTDAGIDQPLILQQCAASSPLNSPVVEIDAPVLVIGGTADECVSGAGNNTITAGTISRALNSRRESDDTCWGTTSTRAATFRENDLLKIAAVQMVQATDGRSPCRKAINISNNGNKQHSSARVAFATNHSQAITTNAETRPNDNHATGNGHAMRSAQGPCRLVSLDTPSTGMALSFRHRSMAMGGSTCRSHGLPTAALQNAHSTPFSRLSTPLWLAQQSSDTGVRDADKFGCGDDDRPGRFPDQAVGRACSGTVHTAVMAIDELFESKCLATIDLSVVSTTADVAWLREAERLSRP